MHGIGTECNDADNCSRLYIELKLSRLAFLPMIDGQSEHAACGQIWQRNGFDQRIAFRVVSPSQDPALEKRRTSQAAAEGYFERYARLDGSLGPGIRFNTPSRVKVRLSFRLALPLGPLTRSVPGIGPIISSAMVAAIGTGDAFTKGRDFPAWLGLVPKQISTGDRTILGKISKRGNRYLRFLFVQAAWVVLIKPKSWQRHGLKPWLEAAKKRLHHNVVAIALANKLARIAWSVLAHGRTFEASKIQAA